MIEDINTGKIAIQEHQQMVQDTVTEVNMITTTTTV